MKKTLIISNIFFIITTLALGYILLFTGTEIVKSPDDTRATVKYPKDLHNLVLSEMRDYLAVISEIQAGLSENNPEKVFKAANRQGQKAIDETPARLLKLSPLACKQMGIQGHLLFQEIADSAKLNFNRTTTLKQLNKLTTNCVVCHQLYKLK